MNNLPTFGRWGTFLVERRSSILFGVFAIAIGAVGREGLKRYLSVPLVCSQPCSDGTVCDPLQFEFEVQPTRMRTSGNAALWYRAALTNRSCSEVIGIPAKGFIDPNGVTDFEADLWLKVTDPSGKKPSRLPPPSADGGMAWSFGSGKGIKIFPKGKIHPYQADREQLEKTVRSGALNDAGGYRLGPGQSLSTVPFELRPYRILALSSSAGGGIAEGQARFDVENPPQYPAPPRGFRLLENYAFSRPGRYVIDAGFSAPIEVGPLFPRWERVPSALKWVLWKIKVAPDDLWIHRPKTVNLKAKSTIIEVDP